MTNLTVGLCGLLLYTQSWAAFFGNVNDDVAPCVAHVAVNHVDAVRSTVSEHASPGTATAEAPSKLINDHLSLQAITRAYQVWRCVDYLQFTCAHQTSLQASMQVFCIALATAFICILYRNRSSQHTNKTYLLTYCL